MVSRVQDVALSTKLYEFVDPNGWDLPAFEAGAHIDIHLPDATVRAYSLLNPPSERKRYVIAVQLAENGKGGSRRIHESVETDDILSVSTPRNNFSLDETAEHSCLIAGGIGITPMLSMVHRLDALGRSWELHYCARTREHAAFVAELGALAARRGSALHYYFDAEQGGARLDIRKLAQASGEDTTLYCCGPAAMLDDFETQTQTFSCRARMERFAATSSAARDGGYTVLLKRSNVTLPIASGSSILDAVLEAGVTVPSSCREGICGACETRVLEGVPDHRDALLSESERAACNTMMICCSGAKSGTLVLDL
jgi:vanillate O-demethylase ferredoxin subunit